MFPTPDKTFLYMSFFPEAFLGGSGNIGLRSAPWKYPIALMQNANTIMERGPNIGTGKKVSITWKGKEKPKDTNAAIAVEHST